ncbi:PREDICTED: brevican core protein [Nanorana parkeri]|uniref:brevican core protein n=1 Tax=Nanorana parkeri TaxID=125878 RepID=UPI000854F74A|nr:PREDICTED: brevican core protein [Nanorana parkeri]
MKSGLVLLLLSVALSSPAVTSEVEGVSKDYKSLTVRIGNSSTKAALSGTLTIPCHITYQSPAAEVTVGRRAVLATPRVKWTFVSNGKEVEILVARGHKVKINEAYRLRASLPRYTTSAYDVTLVLKELMSNDSGVYKCHVQRGIEDDYDMLEVKVKGVVFLYREGLSRYTYTFPMAQEACVRIKAHIATADQLLAAYHGGYEQCDAGWIADQTVRYPIQTPREGCYGDMDGFPGVRNYGVSDPDDMYDVYCYVQELNGEIVLGSTPNKFTLSEARDYCRALGAEMANTGQLYAAWNEGFDHCNPGWLADGSVRYPIVTPRDKCGGNSPGVKTVFQFRDQTGFPDPQARYDVYCFRELKRQFSPSNKDHGESPSPAAERVRDVITVTESFEELRLSEVKAENEAQGFVDTIPLNKTTEATKPADVETVSTARDVQESPAQPTVAVEGNVNEDEDLSPGVASFPPYEDHSEDSEESTTMESKTTAILGHSQGDTPGFVLESTQGTLEGEALPTAGDSILDVSFVNVLAENDYDNFTGSAQELGVTVSESASHIPHTGSPNPTQFSNTEHDADVHTQERTHQGDTFTGTIADTSFSHAVPTTASSILASDVEYSGVGKPLSSVNVDNEPLKSSLDTPVTQPTSAIHPPQDDFEASGHEYNLTLTEEPQTPTSWVEELVSGDHASGTPDPTQSSQILESSLVLTTPLSFSPGPQSFSSPKLSWEEGSGEVPDSTWLTLGGGSISDVNDTQKVERNESEHQELLNNVANTTIVSVQSSYEDNESSTVQKSHLISPNASSGPSAIEDVGVDQYAQENNPFPTSLIGTTEGHRDLVSFAHIGFTPPPNSPRNATSQFLEKIFPPTLNPTGPLPAVSTEKAIVGSSVNFSDVCYPNPCGNGGTCIEEDDDDFHCLCLPGYFGKACEINVEKCPDEWDSFQGFCYRHFYDRKSWEEAETHCRDFGGHLVSVVTPEEQDFVNNQYKDYQWTGLNDRTIEGDFQWSDGNTVLFENWNQGQPDSYFLSGEDCVVTGFHDDGQWSDVPCNYHLPYTCKMGLVTCGPPPEVADASNYGRPKTRYQIGSVVGYRCDDGFIQRNSPVVRCQSDGLWEEPQISCLPSLQ